MAGSADAVRPVIRARGLRVDLPGSRSGVLRRRGGVVRIVNGLDLDIRPGSVTWLVGGAQDGAAEAGRVLVGALDPTAGTVEFDGRDLRALRGRRRARSRRELVMLHAGSEAQLDSRRTAVDVVAAAAAGSARSVGAEHRAHARELLGQVGVDAGSCEGPISGLSPADCRAVDAAGVVALRPRLVVYSPPWKSDPGDDLVWAALTRLRAQASTALVVVTTDLPRALGQDERAMVLCGGRAVEVLGAEDLTHPLHPYTVTLRVGSSKAGADAVGTTDLPEPGARATQGCSFRPDCLKAKARCAAEAPRLTRPLGATHDVACHFPEDPRRTTDLGVEQDGRQARAAGPGSRDEPNGPSDEPTAREFAQG